MYGKFSELYSYWCNQYDLDGIEIDTISKYIKFDNMDVIDLGCGTGRFFLRIIDKAKHIIAVDNDCLTLKILKNNLYSRYPEFVDKVEIVLSNIEDIKILRHSIDIVVFSWSLYALDSFKMRMALEHIYEYLRDDGYIIVLQPNGGDFESIMREYFNINEDSDEYKLCIQNMNVTFNKKFELIAMDRIESYFVVPKIEEFYEILRMFSITEGGCNENEINIESIAIGNKNKKIEENMRLKDEVTLYVYKKR